MTHTPALPNAHADERGWIKDLVQNERIDAVTLLTLKAGTERGHHFHKLSTQRVYVLKGRVLVLTQRQNEPVEQLEVTEGAIVTHYPLERHAFVGLEDSTLLAMTSGPRSGDHYESDTYRLDERLMAPMVTR